MEEKFIVVQCTCYAVVLAEEYARNGKVDNAIAYAFNEDKQRAYDLCKDLNTKSTVIAVIDDD